MKIGNLLNKKFLYFTHPFINYHSIIDGWQNLLSLDETSSKTKIVIAISYQKQQIRSFILINVL